MEELKKALKGNFPLVAILTSVGYLVSYFYQLSIANYYGYPEEYIAFDLDVLLRTFAYFFALALIIFAPMLLYPSSMSKGWLVLIFGLILISLYLRVFSAVNPFSFFNDKKAIGMTTIFGYATVPIFSFYIILSYFDDIKHPKSGVFVLVVSAFLLNTGPNLIGSFSSYAKSQYFQLKQDEKYVLLSSNGGRMIFGSCDSSGVSFLLKDVSSVGELTSIKSKEQLNKIRDCFFNRDFK